MSDESSEFRSEIFGCEVCSNVASFERPNGRGPFYKCPPIIGAPGKARLLFIGINPRRSRSNQTFHDWVMSSRTAFSTLAANRTMDGQPYIARDAVEEHYHCHMIVVEGACGEGKSFESVAAVTELFLCASEDGSKLLASGKSTCAERYLARVINIVKPDVVIAVGSGVFGQLNQYFRNVIPMPIVEMVHPRQMRGLAREQKQQILQPTIMHLVKVLRSHS
ncbi:MAG: hypothetical protein KJ072_18435 [Verrucomicrobia bacterium]|nr:hypothetical protein [Verrucomicrobiota bacterium]